MCPRTTKNPPAIVKVELTVAVVDSTKLAEELSTYHPEWCSLHHPVHLIFPSAVAEALLGAGNRAPLDMGLEIVENNACLIP